MCMLHKGQIKGVMRNSNYKQSWTIDTEKGRHYTNSPAIARQAQELVGQNVALDIMRRGRVIGIERR